MKGDKIVVESHHYRAADLIVPALSDAISACPTRYIMAISGESGSGKSETAQAMQERLAGRGIASVILGQDDYFVYPPRMNDAARRRDPAWLGPAVEVRLGLLDEHCRAAIRGAAFLIKPLVDYAADRIEEDRISLDGIRVVIAEGTYTALLKHVHMRIFIDRTKRETLEHRKKRNRGDEASDQFIEGILETEHKIIAGHRLLADFIITRDYDVIRAEEP
jgi:uridine kinase